MPSSPAALCLLPVDALPTWAARRRWWWWCRGPTAPLYYASRHRLYIAPLCGYSLFVGGWVA